MTADFRHAAAGLRALENLSEKNTVIHQLHSFVKLTAAVVYVAVVISFGRYEVSRLLPYFFYPAILMPISETPFRQMFYRLSMALPFALFGGLANIFFDRPPMFFFGGIVITAGAVSFVSILIKTVLSVWAVLFLVSTTTIWDLCGQLIRLRVPRLLVLQLSLTYRYISSLMEEACAMYHAYILRSPGMKKGVRITDMGQFVGSLLLRSFDRAWNVYAAMKCRGFDGSFSASIGDKEGKLKFSDWLYLFSACVPAVLLRCWS
ncbi:MAG: cobalt ECF transporter T component CbiQ [Synergistaceae bacterium]|jgi:cobalt/nickel transport system permease protein|nr:cobalt ECF transporter T component CbiQ [Synergistaceae bacterium]